MLSGARTCAATYYGTDARNSDAHQFKVLRCSNLHHRRDFYTAECASPRGAGALNSPAQRHVRRTMLLLAGQMVRRRTCNAALALQTTGATAASQGAGSPRMAPR